MESSSLFAQFLTEAPDDVPPDVAAASNDDSGGGGPPDIPNEPPPADDGPPDMGGDDMMDGGMDDGAPPDMGDGGGEEGFDDMGGEDEFGSEEDNPDEQGEEGSNGPPELDEKVSAILNLNLYKRFLVLLNSIGSQLVMIRDNSDILLSLSKDSLKTTNALKRLDKNIRLYLKNSFVNENYSKNLLFFNKCLNLSKLLDDTFNKDISKGIKEAE